MTMEQAQQARIKSRKTLEELIDVLGLDDKQRKRLFEAIEDTHRTDYDFVRHARNDPHFIKALLMPSPMVFIRMLPPDAAIEDDS